MKTCIRVAAIVLAGSMFIGCDNKAKEQADQAAQPSKPAVDTTAANNAMQTAGDTVKTDAQKAADAAKSGADKASDAMKSGMGKLDDAGSKLTAPKMPGN